MSLILVVDDELSMREFLTILLEKDGHKVVLASDAQSALQISKEQDLDLVISDIRMPGMGGLELLAEIKKIKPDLPVIMITAFALPEDAVTAMKNGAFDYITKPFKVNEIKKVIRAATTRKETQQKEASSELFQEIIGQSPELIKIFDLII